MLGGVLALVPSVLLLFAVGLLAVMVEELVGGSVLVVVLSGISGDRRNESECYGKTAYFDVSLIDIGPISCLGCIIILLEYQL